MRYQSSHFDERRGTRKSTMGKVKRRQRGSQQAGEGADDAATAAAAAASEPRVRLQVRGYEDVADSEDEFHLNQDKVLLDEGPAAKRLKRAQQQGLFFRGVMTTSTSN